MSIARFVLEIKCPKIGGSPSVNLAREGLFCSFILIVKRDNRKTFYAANSVYQTGLV